VGLVQSVQATNINDIGKGETWSFDTKNDGTTVWKNSKIGTYTAKSNGEIISGPSASSSRADSASAAKSQNIVKCFAFCLGISTANSGSAANSDSRSNSPGNTATSMPVAPKTTTALQTKMDGPLEQLQRGEISTIPNPKYFLPANSAIVKKGTTECIDNTGSDNDEGYSQGYVDSQRDWRGLNGHGFDDSVNHGNANFKTGYKDGYLDGWWDARGGTNKNPC